MDRVLEAFSPVVKTARCVKLTSYLHLSAKDENEWSYIAAAPV
jgi:hypothetical protein